MGLINWYLNLCDRWMPFYSRPQLGDGAGEAACAHCEEQIDPTLAACPKCGNNPEEEMRANGKKLTLIGLVCTITVIGSIIGIPLILLGLMSFMGAASTGPTEADVIE